MREICYEVRLALDPAIQAEFDAWLAAHVETLVALPGLQDARLITPEPSVGGRKPRGERVQTERAGTEPPAPRCPNCNAVAEGGWCAACGQEQKDYHIAFNRLALDYLGDTFMFDSRLFRSLKLLLFKPGGLTRENLDGRRARYIPALRLYLFSALIFFTLSAVVMDWRSGNSEQGLASGAAEVEAEIAADKDAGAWERAIGSAGIRAMERPELFMQSWISNISLSMLIFLPVYALLLKLLYIRSSYYYLEHLIFALHVHAFVFFVFTLALLYTQYLNPLAPRLLNDVLAGSITIYTVVYTLPALKRVYSQGWLLTILKYLTLGVVYFFTVSFGVIAVMFVSMFSL